MRLLKKKYGYVMFSLSSVDHPRDLKYKQKAIKLNNSNNNNKKLSHPTLEVFIFFKNCVNIL